VGLALPDRVRHGLYLSTPTRGGGNERTVMSRAASPCPVARKGTGEPDQRTTTASAQDAGMPS
jgi:hypothetical protein